MKFTIARKIWLIVGILTSGYLFSTVSGFIIARNNENSLRIISHDLTNAALGSQSALESFNSMIRQFNDAVMTGESSFLKSAEKDVESMNSSIEKIMNTRNLPKYLLRNIENINASLTQLINTCKEVYPRMTTDIDNEDLVFKAKMLANKINVLRGELEQFRDNTISSLHEKTYLITASTKRQNHVNLAILIIVFSISCALTIYIATKSIAGPLKKTVSFAGLIAYGEYSSRLDISQSDEIGELSDALNTMADRLGYSMSKLKDHQENLELLVRERTTELEKTHKELLTASRRAGMAEVATGVLHNVGNILNSINISVELIRRTIIKSRMSSLDRLSAALNQHKDNLPVFLSSKQGKQLPKYLSSLSDECNNEHSAILEISRNLIDHIQNISIAINMQQDLGKPVGVSEMIKPEDLIEDILKMEATSFDNNHIHLVRDYQDIPPCLLDRYKISQIIINIINNARQAMDDVPLSERTLTVKCFKQDDNFFCIEITDTGVGISQDTLIHIFEYGFTTRKDGHGYGLHSCANAAREMKGTLTGQSDGLNMGSKFTLTLPYIKERKPEKV